MNRPMYAIAKDGFVCVGTAAYSRQIAIKLFCNGDYRDYDRETWNEFKRAGYRTVRLAVTIEDQP